MGSGRLGERGRKLGAPGERGWELEASGEWDRGLEAPRELDRGLERPRRAEIGARGTQVLLYFDLCSGDSMFCLSWPVLVGIPNGKPRRVAMKGGRRKACLYVLKTLLNNLMNKDFEIEIYFPQDPKSLGMQA